jgi:general secretion pathway protein C
VKQYFWIINLGLITLLAYTGSDLFLNYMESILQEGPAPLTSTPLATTPQVERRSFNAYAVIEQRNIFNSTPESKVPPPRPTPKRELPKERPRTTLNLKLLGTVVGSVLSTTYAIIEDTTTRKQDVYQLGDIVQEATIIEIDRHRVVLKNGDREEVLLSFQEGVVSQKPPLPQREQKSELRKPPPAEGVRQVDQHTWRVSREAFIEQIENVNRFMTEVRVVPNFKDGNPDGFRIASIKPQSFLESLGLKRGDVLKGVNGLKINNPEEAFRAYQQVQTQSTITLDVERDNQLQSFTFEIR